MTTSPDLCPCGGQQDFSECCGRFIEGQSLPQTAEQLMRSRYSAFVLADAAYLLASWHPATRPSRVRLDPEQRWLGLSIKATEAGSDNEATGTVEFVARYKIHGSGHRLHEISRFEQIDGRWYYLNGEHR